MKIWLINQYNMPPEYGHLNRHYNLAKYLKEIGQEPSVFVGSYLHNTKIQMITDEDTIVKYNNCNFEYFFIKTCNYESSKVKRIIAMIQFYLNTYKYLRTKQRPDVILGSSAHPFAAILAINLAKKMKSQSIVEIRDLWPESIVAYGILKKNNPLLRLLYLGEKWIYQHADKLVFTMEGGVDYLYEHGWLSEQGGAIDKRNVYHLNNGVDLDVFNDNRDSCLFDDIELNNNKVFKVIYTGSIRLVNNVKKIIDAAMEIKKKGVHDIRFIIYGDGDDRKSLEDFCIENQVDNVTFKGLVGKSKIPYILSKSDLNILHFEQNNIKRYGASLNKLFEYFASGKPTISDCEFGYDLIKKYRAGVVIDGADATALAEEIIRIKNMNHNDYESNDLIYYEGNEAEKLSEQVLSLPIHPYLNHSDVDYIADTLIKGR